jgi:hypothetical protein
MTKNMKCPCETCLVRIPCRTKVVRKDRTNKEDYLVIQFLEQCPYISKYFGMNKYGTFNHSFDQINELLNIFRVPDQRFVWLGSTIGIYE